MFSFCRWKARRRAAILGSSPFRQTLSTKLAVTNKEFGALPCRTYNGLTMFSIIWRRSDKAIKNSGSAIQKPVDLDTRQALMKPRHVFFLKAGSKTTHLER